MPGRNLTIKRIVEKAKNLHRWNITPREAIEIQKRLASKVSLRSAFRVKKLGRLVSFDISAKRFGKTLYAVAVVWDVKRRGVIGVSRARVPVRFPYVPGLLSFREMPAMIEAMSGLEEVPDLLLCDAQGIMHPRRFGLASHMGVATGIPSIGCAKSWLVGEFGEIGEEKGKRADVEIGGKKVGYVLRTRRSVKPLFVSPGHMVSCAAAADIVLSLVDKTRIPEPLRAAHHEAVTFMRSKEG